MRKTQRNLRKALVGLSLGLLVVVGANSDAAPGDRIKSRDPIRSRKIKEPSRQTVVEAADEETDAPAQSTSPSSSSSASPAVAPAAPSRSGGFGGALVDRISEGLNVIRESGQNLISQEQTSAESVTLSFPKPGVKPAATVPAPTTSSTTTSPRVAPVPAVRTVPSVDTDVVAARVLSGRYILRAGKGTDTKRVGLMEDYIAGGVRITESDDIKWLKVTTASGETGYVNRFALKPIRIQGDYNVRRSPSKDSGQKMGMVRELRSDRDLIITGRTSGSGTDKWVEVIFNGEPGWVHADAVMDGIPEEKAASPSTPKRPAAPEVETSGEVADAEPAAPAAPVKECISSSRSKMQAHPRFRGLLEGPNLFTKWTANVGPFKAHITVNADGTAFLDAPFRNRMQLAISICMDANNQPYIDVQNTPIYFNGGAQRSSITVPDPTKPTDSYEFHRGVQ